MRLLVVEDDAEISGFVVKGLREAGFAVDHAPDGPDGLHLALQGHYDAAIVDIMLPGLDGIGMIEQVRRAKVNTPVLILSAKRSVDDRIRGLQSGGDDYLVKPFVFAELLARVNALIRRSGNSAEPARLVFRDLSMDLMRREVFRSSSRIDLQPREFSLLEYFLRNPERVLTKTMILESIWDYRFDPQTNVVDVLVSRLRSKVDKDFPEKLIHTVRGMGYVLKEAD
jgi:two-component system, OmpR family, response regulator